MMADWIVGEQHRMRAGIIILVIGLLLLLWAWGSWAYRASVPETAHAIARGQGPANYSVNPTAGQPEGPPAGRHQTTPSLLMSLLFAVILVLAFLLLGYVVLRAGRRSRELLGASQGTVTDTRDAWAMHKPPSDSQGGDVAHREE